MIWLTRRENHQRMVLRRMAARMLARWPESMLDPGGAEQHLMLVEAGLVGADDGVGTLRLTQEGMELVEEFNGRRSWAPG